MAQKSIHYVSPEQVAPIVAEIFDACRQHPGTPFDEHRFLQFLVADTSKPIGNSWLGTRLRARFMKRIEEGFFICVPDAEFERNWTLLDFCSWISERSGKDAANRMLAARRRFASGGCLLPLLLVTAAGLLVGLQGNLAVLVSGALAGVVTLALAVFLASNFRHFQRIARARGG